MFAIKESCCIECGFLHFKLSNATRERGEHHTLQAVAPKVDWNELWKKCLFRTRTSRHRLYCKSLKQKSLSVILCFALEDRVKTTKVTIFCHFCKVFESLQKL